MCPVKWQFAGPVGKTLKIFRLRKGSRQQAASHRIRVNRSGLKELERQPHLGCILLINQPLSPACSLGFLRRWGRGVPWNQQLPPFDHRVAVADHQVHAG